MRVEIVRSMSPQVREVRIADVAAVTCDLRKIPGVCQVSDKWHSFFICVSAEDQWKEVEPQVLEVLTKHGVTGAT
jgi:hypothetical protein